MYPSPENRATSGSDKINQTIRHVIKYVYLCENTVLSLENEIELLTNYFNFTSELS